jgi:hypothetical protein
MAGITRPKLGLIRSGSVHPGTDGSAGSAGIAGIAGTEKGRPGIGGVGIAKPQDMPPHEGPSATRASDGVREGTGVRIEK